jgi:peptide/nickel transport system substrate-binding protein
MSNLTRRQFLRVSALATAGAALAACGKKKEEVVATLPPVAVKATEAKPVEKATEAPKGPPRPAAWPVGDVPRNRTLYYYNNTPMVDVCNAFGSGYNHQNGNAILYEPCAFYGVHADKNYLWLAESYKYSADAKECTITFRKGIKWSDGAAFKAADVAWCMETLKKVTGLQRQGVYTKELEKAEAVDDITLKVTLNQIDWRFFFKSLTFRFDLGDDTAVQAPQMYTGVADADMPAYKVYDMAKGWPISTGPYGVGVANDQYTNYDLRPTWWAADTGFVASYPDVWRITQQPFTNDTMAAQLLINKEIDHPLDLRPLVVANILTQAEHLTTWTGRKPPYGYMDWWPISIYMCNQKPPWDNPKVRWALAYAIDQKAIVSAAWFGAGIENNSPYPGYPKLNALMEGIKDITDQYNPLEYNLEKSAALMTEAGFAKDKDGFWADKDGKRVDADIYAGVPLFGDLAPVIAEKVRAGGFQCDHKAPPDVWAAKVDGRASLYLFGHGGATIDPWDTFNLYYPVPVAMGQQEWSNISRWQNDEFKAIADEMNNTAMDDPKMKDLFRRGMEIWYKELPDCPLCQWYHRIPVNTWYWENWPNQENPYMNSALWHLTMLVVVLGLKATNKS